MKTKKEDWVIGVGICVVLLLVLIPVTALAVPGVINYQGYLTDAGGSPLNGEVAIIFRIWNAQVAGTEAWSESHASVEVSDGVFNVLLGSSVPIGAGILEGNRWLGMTVGADPEMTPRMKMTSVAYAIRAGHAESVAVGSVGTSALSDTAVTEAKIASGAVTSGKLGSGSVTPDKVASGAVSSEKIASGAVTGAKVAAGTLTASHLQDGSALAEILDDDGPGSGLNADFLDGQHASAFSLAGHNHDGAYVNETGDAMSATSSGSVLVVTNTGTGYGLSGYASGESGRAVYGHASNSGDVTNTGGWFTSSGTTGRGVFGGSYGTSGRGVWGSTSGASGVGVYGSATNAEGVLNFGGYFTASGIQGQAVHGEANNAGSGDVTNYGGWFTANGASGRGVYGSASNNGDVTNYGGWFTSYGTTGKGVFGGAYGTNGWGVWGSTSGGSGVGVRGTATDTAAGTNYGGYFRAYSTTGRGVYGYASNDGDYQNYGVYGEAVGKTGRGVAGEATGTSGIGVRGLASNTGNVTNYGGYFTAQGTSGIGIYASGGSSGKAAVFRGNVEIKRESDGTTIMELGVGLDYAEGFQVTDRRELGPGSVLIIDPENPGKLALSTAPYDSKVAGIVSGANGLGSGVRLSPGQFDHDVALAGRVYCNVDATREGVEPGDLLTTSDVPGHAMKAKNHERAQGAVLGKAMQKLEKGTRGQILVLVTLQ